MKTKIITVCIIAVFSWAILSCYAVDKQDMQVITYHEVNDTIKNPDCGFYYPMSIACKPTGMDKNKPIYNKDRLVHLRFGLKAFSIAGNLDRDYDITPEMLEALDAYMNQIRQAGGSAIIRFAYDNFNGDKNLEPSIEQIEKHIWQLKPFFTTNADVIISVESGFLGPWGEQHSSSIVTKENMKRVVDALLLAVPENRGVTVRKPEWYCAASGVDISQIDSHITTKGNPYYRLGIFNDGYLGSSSDLGTYKNRKKELQWLFTQATHTIFGGEAVKGTMDTDENGYLYNSPEHIEQEMFITHTAYLNEAWNDQLIGSWKNTPYTGLDPLYAGKSAFEFIENHLGYRIVLKNASLPYTAEKGTDVSFQITMENVGAGNVVNAKDVYLILQNTKGQHAVLLQEDITTLLSKQTKTVTIPFSVSNTLETGDYEIYLKVVNQGDGVETNKRCIQFANKDIWDASISANHIGSMEVIEKISEDIEKPDEDVDHDNTDNNQNQGNMDNDVNQEDKDTIIDEDCIEVGDGLYKTEQVEKKKDKTIPDTSEHGNSAIVYIIGLLLVIQVMLWIRCSNKDEYK